MLRIIPANVNALKLKNQGKMGAFLNLATCALFSPVQKSTGGKVAGKMRTRSALGGSVEEREQQPDCLLPEFEVLYPPTCTPCIFTIRSFFFFFHRQTKSALFPPWKTKHLVMSRSINTFSFFFFLIKNFFQLFPIFIFFPQNKIDSFR